MVIENPSSRPADIFNRQRSWFRSFLHRTTQKRATASALEESLPSLAPDVSEAIRDKRQVTVWNIGAGMGTEYLPLIRRLERIAEHPWPVREKNPHANSWGDDYYDEFPSADSLPLQSVRTVVAEPNLGVLIPFCLDYLLAGLDFRALSCQQDPKPTPLWDQDKPADLAIASHVFYYLPDQESAVRNMYNALAPGGAMCIILGSEEGALHRLRKRFFPLLYGTSSTSAEDIERLLDRLGMRYSTTSISSSVNL